MIGLSHTSSLVAVHGSIIYCFIPWWGRGGAVDYPSRLDMRVEPNPGEEASAVYNFQKYYKNELPHFYFLFSPTFIASINSPKISPLFVAIFIF